MTYEEMKTRIGEAIETHLAELICQNDDIARHPELSGKEYRSAQKHVALLQKHGYRTEFPFAGLETAFRSMVPTITNTKLPSWPNMTPCRRSDTRAATV